MAWIVTMVALAGIAAAIWAARTAGAFTSTTVARVRDLNDPTGVREIEHTVTKSYPLWAVIGIGILILILTFTSAYWQVDAGHIGVVRQFGEITGTVEEGPHFLPPWQTVSTVDIRAQTTYFGISEKDNEGNGKLLEFPIMEAASSETQDIFVAASVTWRVDGTQVEQLIREVGVGFFDKLGIPNRMEEAVKETTTGYEAVTIPGLRSVIAAQAEEKLTADLAPFHIVVESINIANIGFSSTFNDAIERKQQATQDALTAAEKVSIAEQEANAAEQTAIGEAAKRREEARGSADAVVLEAEGEAKAITTVAIAQAEANDVVAASLTPELLRKMGIDALPKTVVFLPSDGTINLIDLAAALASETAAPAPAP